MQAIYGIYIPLVCFLENVITFWGPLRSLLSRESELVGIIASQVEFEQSERYQMRGNNTERFNAMGVIEEGGDEDEQKEQHQENGEGVISDHEWTRGPIQLQYDDDVGPQIATAENNPTDGTVMNDSEREGNSDDGDEKSAADESPLRLRGGVGLPRTKSIKSAQTAPQGDLSERRTTSSISAAAVGEYDGTGEADDSPAQSMNKRPPPHPSRGGMAQNSGAQAAKRHTPLLRAPGGLRRSTSITGGSFKPPRSAGAYRKIREAASESGPELTASSADNSQQPPMRDEPKRGLSEMFEGAEPVEEKSDKKDGSDLEERSQLVVPGWGSQGNHPVEYSEGHLSFVSTSQLRTSPSLIRRRSGDGLAGNEPESAPGLGNKKQKVLGEEGRSHSSGSMDIAGHGDTASPADDRDGAATGSTTETPQKSAVGQVAKPSLSKAPSFEVDYEFEFGGTQQAIKPTATFVATAYTAGAAAEGQVKAPSYFQPNEKKHGCDEEDKHKESKTDEPIEDVQSRWAGADARLRLAQARGTPPPSFRKQRGDASSARRGRESAKFLSLEPGAEDDVSGVPNVRRCHPSSLASSPVNSCDTAAKLRQASKGSPSTVENRLGTMKGQFDTVETPSSMSCSSALVIEATTTITSKPSPSTISEISLPTGVNEKRRRPSPRLRSISIAKVPVKGKTTPAGIANAPAVHQSINSPSPGRPQHGSAGDIGQRYGDGARSKSVAPRKGLPVVGSASVRQENGRNRSVASADLSNVRAATLPTENPAKAKFVRQNASPKTPSGTEQRQRFQRAGDNNLHIDDVNVAASPVTLGAAASSPAASLASPTSFSPAGLDWGHSPALPLSGHSDHSDMIPLGQRSPALPITTSPVSRSAADVRKGRGLEGGKAVLSGQPSSRKPRMPLTPGRGVTGSPDGRERVFSGFTPPSPRPRAVSGRSEVAVLKPREIAPDPKACAATLARLGVPQVGR